MYMIAFVADTVDKVATQLVKCELYITSQVNFRYSYYVIKVHA